MSLLSPAGKGLTSVDYKPQLVSCRFTEARLEDRDHQAGATKFRGNCLLRFGARAALMYYSSSWGRPRRSFLPEWLRL
jgi:hypothetical protein